MSLLIKEPSSLFLYCSLVEMEQAMRKHKLKGSFVSCITIFIASFFHGSFIINATELEAVNYYHKELHLGCCSSPRVVSDNVLYNVWALWKFHIKSKWGIRFFSKCMIWVDKAAKMWLESDSSTVMLNDSTVFSYVSPFMRFSTCLLFNYSITSIIQ